MAFWAFLTGRRNEKRKTYIQERKAGFALWNKTVLGQHAPPSSLVVRLKLTSARVAGEPAPPICQPRISDAIVIRNET